MINMTDKISFIDNIWNDWNQVVPLINVEIS